jgi:hypothetical protein
MALNFAGEIAKIASTNLFERDEKTGAFETGIFIGRPFHIGMCLGALESVDSCWFWFQR